jgi:hypothetical protein
MGGAGRRKWAGWAECPRMARKRATTRLVRIDGVEWVRGLARRVDRFEGSTVTIGDYNDHNDNGNGNNDQTPTTRGPHPASRRQGVHTSLQVVYRLHSVTKKNM